MPAFTEREAKSFVAMILAGLKPVLDANGAIDMTIIEGPLPGTGQVRYAAFPEAFGLDPWVKGFDDLDENAKITIRHNCGARVGGGIGELPPGFKPEPDNDPALKFANSNEQRYGFIGRTFPCFADPTAPMGYRIGRDWLENTTAWRFPSTEMALRKAIASRAK